MSLVGQQVPNWKATAYLNGEEVELSSSDYSSGWYVLYFYPLDFTFICPTEIKGFQSLRKDFEDIGVAVIGGSTSNGSGASEKPPLRNGLQAIGVRLGSRSRRPGQSPIPNSSP